MNKILRLFGLQLIKTKTIKELHKKSLNASGYTYMTFSSFFRSDHRRTQINTDATKELLDEVDEEFKRIIKS